MTVKDIARPKEELVSASLDTPAWELAQMMNEKRVGCIIIERDGRAEGIVTDRDIALEIVGRRRDHEQLTAGDIMTENPFTVDGDHEVFDLFAKMSEFGVRRFPVMDDGELFGIVTLDDTLSVIHDEMGKITDVVKAESPPHPNL